MKHLHPIFLFCMVLCCANVSGETADQRLTAFARKAVLFNRNFPQEKAYLHFDNTGYFLGETIWYKAYVVNAIDNSPTALSKTLYVEMLTQEGEVLESQKIKINNGVGSGSFTLPDSLPGGFYQVRAYTRGMLNFGQEYLFSRVFPMYSVPQIEGDYRSRIMEKRENKVPQRRDKDTTIQMGFRMHFYPEGGSLVYGLENSVAFKATDDGKTNLDLTGVVVDENGKTVAQINTLHRGMGRFMLKPDNQQYKAKVRYQDKTYSVNLPKVETSGYTLQLTQKGEGEKQRFQLRIQTSEDKYRDSVAIMLLSRGKLVEFNTFDLPKGNKELDFEARKLQDGVNQLFLYASDGRLLAERMFFVEKNSDKSTNAERSYSAEGNNNNNNGKPNSTPSTTLLQATTDKKSYKPYEKIQLTLQALDTTALRGGTSISLSVRDAKTSDFSGPDKQNIATTLLLASDLKGLIETPTWYFDPDNKERKQALDLLLATQGWSRYQWEQISALKPLQVKHPIEEGLLLDGEVRSIIKKKPVPNVDLTMWMTQGGQSHQGKIKTDSAGAFAFLLPNVYEDWKLNMETAFEDKVKDFRILLHRQFSPQPLEYHPLNKTVWINKPEAKEEKKTTNILGKETLIQEANPTNPLGLKELQLKEVVKTANKLTTFKEEVLKDATEVVDVPKELEKGRDLAAHEGSVMEMLEEWLPYYNMGEKYGSIILLHRIEVKTLIKQIRYKGKPVRFKVFSSEGTSMNALSDIYTFEYVGTVSNGINPDILASDIEKISILEDDQAIYYLDNDILLYKDFPESENTPVYIFIYLKKDFNQDRLGVRTTTFQGYKLSKKFYSPTYPEGEPVYEKDYRRTLYWHPDLILDKSGKATVEFFNNTTCTKMDISAEGITGRGTLLYNE